MDPHAAASDSLYLEATSEELRSQCTELHEDGHAWVEHFKKIVNGDDDFFPIPWLPSLPRAGGKGSRVRARRRRLAAVREVAERTWTSLNETGTSVPLRAQLLQGHPCHLAAAPLSAEHKEAWRHILREAQRLEHARRVSFQAMPTGAELVKGLLKQCADLYSHTARLDRYVP